MCHDPQYSGVVPMPVVSASAQSAVLRRHKVKTRNNISPSRLLTRRRCDGSSAQRRARYHQHRHPPARNTAAAAEFLVVTGTSSRSTADFPAAARQQLPQHITITHHTYSICFSCFTFCCDNNRQKTTVSISVIPYFWVLWLCCLTNIWVVTNNFCTKYNIGRMVCLLYLCGLQNLTPRVFIWQMSTECWIYVRRGAN